MLDLVISFFCLHIDSGKSQPLTHINVTYLFTACARELHHEQGKIDYVALEDVDELVKKA